MKTNGGIAARGISRVPRASLVHSRYSRSGLARVIRGVPEASRIPRIEVDVSSARLRRERRRFLATTSRSAKRKTVVRRHARPFSIAMKTR